MHLKVNINFQTFFMPKKHFIIFLKHGEKWGRGKSNGEKFFPSIRRKVLKLIHIHFKNSKYKKNYDFSPHK